VAQQNRRRARKGGSGGPRKNPAADAGVNPDRPFPELESGEEQLTEAQIAVGRPDVAETPSESELIAFEEQQAGHTPVPPAPAPREAAGTGQELAPHAGSESLPARAVGFLQGSWRELQRVQWPDRRQVFQATGVVLGFVIVAGAFLGVASFAAQKIVNLLLYGHG
jgi:preprotein translocase subunit SecE